MIAFIFYLATIAQSIKVEYDKGKIKACLGLLRVKLEEAEDELEDILATTLQDEEMVINKIVADMMTNCLTNITEETTKFIMNNETITLNPNYNFLVAFNKQQFFEGKDPELTPLQLQIFEQLKIYRKEIESRSFNFSYLWGFLTFALGIFIFKKIKNYKKIKEN
ncbi:unnamed protein product [Blepharisma stoltei]|uniref:Uncharacterized protein n=1 Tax=Blepharisma stoltei TaxID=1481888 RepID=A0AAU9K957_9CILI|nr:unnamed protein product [Blepharisma stoltei]